MREAQVIEYAQRRGFLKKYYARSSPLYLLRFDSSRFRYNFTKKNRYRFFSKWRFTNSDAESPSPASLSMLVSILFLFFVVPT
jgi:hypothetical protein